MAMEARVSRTLKAMPDCGRSRAREARPTSLAIGLVLLLLGALPDPALGQGEALTSVEGFNGIPWGAPASAIREKYGSPAQTDSLDNGIVVLAYREAVLDLPAATLYAVLPDRGLVKGQHMVNLDLEAGDCEGQYGRLRDHIKFTFPLLTPVENPDYPLHSDFCAAVRDGAGAWATQWIDRSTRSIITVIVERGSTEVKLIFESGLFLDWLGVTLPPENVDG
jgi:hypothetical protein